MRVGVIGLAALPGRIDPHPRRQLRRYVDDSLAMVEQAKDDVLADALTALDRPHPLRPGRRDGQHRLEPSHVRGEPPTI